MHKTIRKKIKGYALPLALIYVAIFSIIVVSIGPRSNLQNQTTISITNHFKAKVFLLNYIDSFLPGCLPDCPPSPDPNYSIVFSQENNQVSVKITSNDNKFSTTLNYP
jgi:hypothetical protein